MKNLLLLLGYIQEIVNADYIIKISGLCLKIIVKIAK